MRVGVSLATSLDVADARVGARWIVERARAASEAGLDSLFVGDHHVEAARPYYQNSPTLGHLLATWSGPAAGALFLLPLWHPVLVAEQVATLAALTDGRFILQCSVGRGRRQFAGMGGDLGDRATAMETNLVAIRRLLAGEEVTVQVPGLERPVEGAQLALLPSEPVEVWMGGHATPVIDRAARLADGWLANPRCEAEEAARLLREYHDACNRHDRPPQATAIRRFVHVGSDAKDARRLADDAFRSGAAIGVEPTTAIVGGPDEVAAELRRFARLGYTDVLLRHFVARQEEVLASYGRLAAVREALIADGHPG